MDQKTLNILELAFIVLLPTVSIMIRQYIQRKRDEFAWEYYVKFLRPKMERALMLGISQKRLNELWQEAQNYVTDPTIVGGAPGSIFDSLIDREIEEQNHS